MLSLQDLMHKTEKPRQLIHETLQKGYYHPDDASIYTGLNQADQHEVREAFDNISLAEILMYGSANQGADDLVAAKLHDTLIRAARTYDICPSIGYVTDKWEGGDLKIQIEVDGTYVPKPFRSGGTLNDVNAQFVQATASPIGYGLPINVGESDDFKEYGIVQWHVEKAAQACGQLASEKALAVLIATADGDGTLNAGASGNADNTRWTTAGTTGIDTAYNLNGADNFKSDSIITSTTSWIDSIYSTIPAGTVVMAPKKTGFDFNIAGIDLMIWHNATTLTNGASKLMTLVFDSKNALLTGRKRWMEIKQFTNPLEDIDGAVVSFRQDSVTLYKDAICKITET